MRFQVPQFIEIEDKIFGPFTFKQAIYLAGGVGICVALFFTLHNIIAFFIALPIALLSLALAFYKVNGKPFINTVESFFKYSVGSKLYTWKKEQKKVIAKEDTLENTNLFVPKLSQNKLEDLTWSLDVKRDINSSSTPQEKR
jgi:hypothetical protein